MTRFRLRFNQYKSNIKLNGEESRGSKQEKLIEKFFLLSHNGTREDIKVLIIGHCDLNDQKTKEEFLDFLSGLFPSKRFKSKTRIKILNKLIQYFDEHFRFNSSGSQIQKDNCLIYYEHVYIE